MHALKLNDECTYWYVFVMKAPQLQKDFSVHTGLEHCKFATL